MRSAAETALGYVAGCSFDDFCGDGMRCDAVLWQLMLLGEAAKRMSRDERAAEPGLPWREMSRMRDYLVHRYDSIRLEIVWETVTEDLPEVVRELRVIAASRAG